MEQEKIRQMVITCRQQAEQLRRLARLAEQRESGEIGLSGDALFQAAVIIESLCSVSETAAADIGRLKRSEAQLIVERDTALTARHGV